MRNKAVCVGKRTTQLAFVVAIIIAGVFGVVFAAPTLALADEGIEVVDECGEERDALGTEGVVSDEGIQMMADVSGAATGPSIAYQAHVQNVGWMSWVSNGTTAGTEGRALQMEALSMRVEGLQEESIRYQSHLADVGWQGWKNAGQVSGTVGQGRRMEAVRIELTGKAASTYDVVYRAHVPNKGWLDWAKNGEVAGSEGMSLRIEALQVKIVSKGSQKSGLSALRKPKLGIEAHSANIGWQASVGEGATAGTTGRSLRLEAICLSFPGFGGTGSSISSRAHVSDIGWMGWTSSGSVIGTTGRGKAMEAIEIRMAGDAQSFFDVYYRVHVSNYGWLGYACNGETAGSTGMSLPIEAVEVRVVAKGTAFNRGGSATVQPRPVAQPPVSSTSWYESEVEGFLSDPRWKNGASWASGQRPKIANYSASGCCAYAVDFCKYVFGEDSYRSGQEFYNPGEIRAGDIIKVVGSQHWFVVLGRSGGSLYTAEGNWGGRVVVADGTYTVSGNTLCRNGSKFRTFSAGYHML